MTRTADATVEAATASGDAAGAAAAQRDARIKGLILAAGAGRRLGKAGEEVPKCLLEIARRRLVEHQLDALAEAGIGPTALVIGYGADEVRETVGIRAEYYVNTRWSHTNSLYSFRLAREWLTGPVVVMNSDVLFSPRILERLLEVDGDAIAFDSSSGRNREQMAVEVADGRVAGMSKDLPPERISGENVGILKLTAETVTALLDEADRRIDGGDEKSWLAAAVSAVASSRTLTPVDVADLPWVEIDFSTDLVRARKEVWPRIKREKAPLAGRRRATLLAGLGVLLILALLFRVLFPPAPEQWETIGLDGSFHEHVLLGEPGQSWWVLDAARPVRFAAPGPGPLRIDTRLLDPEPAGGQYVIEVLLGGQRAGWYLEDARESGTYAHERWKIGKRGRVTVELAAGLHDVEVRLVAPASAQLLLRARYQADARDD